MGVDKKENDTSLNVPDCEKLEKIEKEEEVPADDLPQPKHLYGTLLNVSTISDMSNDITVTTYDANQTHNLLHTRLLDSCKDYGTRVITEFNKKTWFYINICLVLLSIIVLISCYMAFVPKAAEKVVLHGYLNESSRLLTQCSYSFEILQKTTNETKHQLSQCNLRVDDLGNQNTDLTTRLTNLSSQYATKEKEVKGLLEGLEQKSNLIAQLGQNNTDLTTRLTNVSSQYATKVKEVKDLLEGLEQKSNLIVQLGQNNNQLKDQVADLMTRLSVKEKEANELLQRMGEKTDTPFSGFFRFFSGSQSVKSSLLLTAVSFSLLTGLVLL